MADTPNEKKQLPPKSNALVEKFKELPRPAQYGIVGLAGFFIIIFVLRGGNDQPTPATERAAAPAQTEVSAIEGPPPASVQGQSFQGLTVERPEILQTWLQQQQQALTDMQDDLEVRFQELEEEKSNERAELDDLRSEIRQMIQTFQSEIQSLNETNRRDRDLLSQLAEETRKLQLQAPVQEGAPAPLPSQRRQRISQTPLGGGGSVPFPTGNAPLQPIVDNVRGTRDFVASGGRTVGGNGALSNVASGNLQPEPEELKQPFIPPLGFVKATLLNGVDALAGGGIATPALVRLSGTYQTAMNSTVSLDGCFALVEFEGDISTERALGRPSQMTCIYPDRGAVTYNVSGYVVDVQDGIIGMPGIFYEGNAGRLATAMVADFVAGVAQIIEQNQQTTTVSPDGTTITTLTGDQLRTELAGGVNNSIASLRDYLFERANRILPFIRIDATRQIHLVLLSGTDLRQSGDVWTDLYDANNAP